MGGSLCPFVSLEEEEKENARAIALKLLLFVVVDLEASSIGSYIFNMNKKPDKDEVREAAWRGLSALVDALDLEEYRFPPFENWKELQEAREESGLVCTDPEEGGFSEKLKVSLSCLDVMHLYTTNIAFSMFEKLLLRKQVTPKFQATFTIFSGIAADIGAIGTLCRQGYDIQAKTILRGLREKVDCAIAVQLDRSFAVGYVRAEGSHEINEFWHSRISRGKLKKNIQKRLSHYSRSGEAPLDERWFARRASFERWLGAAVHPSHTTGLISAFPNFGEEEAADCPGWFGQPSDISIATIRSVMALAFELVLLARWRNLVDSQSLRLLSENRELEGSYDYHLGLEKFLDRCTANSVFGPNVEICKILLFFDGYALMPIDREMNFEEYDREIFNNFVALLEKAQTRLKEKLDKLKASDDSFKI